MFDDYENDAHVSEFYFCELCGDIIEDYSPEPGICLNCYTFSEREDNDPSPVDLNI